MFSLRTSTPRALLVRRIHHSSRVAAVASRAPRDAATPIDYTMKIMAAANAGKFGNGLHYAARMKEAKVSPNISVYNALLGLAASENSWLFSWAIFDDMLQLGIQPTATSFAHLIQVPNIGYVLASHPNRFSSRHNINDRKKTSGMQSRKCMIWGSSQISQRTPPLLTVLSSKATLRWPCTTYSR